MYRSVLIEVATMSMIRIFAQAYIAGYENVWKVASTELDRLDYGAVWVIGWRATIVLKGDRSTVRR